MVTSIDTVLNQRQAAFVEAYLHNGGNAKMAYAKAYPDANCATQEVNGHKLLSTTKVQRVICQRRTEILDASTITLEKKRLALWSIAADSMLPDETGKGMKDPSAAVAAIAELNRMDGHRRSTHSATINELSYF